MDQRRWRIGLGVAAVAAVAATSRVLPLGSWLSALGDVAVAAGGWGAVGFGAVYVAATVALLPASALTLMAGLLWGPWGGLLVVWPAAVCGAGLSFLAGRTLLREAVAERAAASPRFAAVDRVVGEDGFTVVLLLRLSPLFPFGLLNYGLGATRVPAARYLAATAVGILPGTLLYAWLGASLGSVADVLDGAPAPGGAGRALGLFGLLATAGVTALITQRARAALESRLAPREEGT